MNKLFNTNKIKKKKLINFIPYQIVSLKMDLKKFMINHKKLKAIKNFNWIMIY